MNNVGLSASRTADNLSSDTTIIRDLQIAMRSCRAVWRLPLSGQHQAHREHSRLLEGAERAFGPANGWRISERDFRISDIGKRIGDFAATDSRLLDHCIWYRGAGKCAAIVAQPYASACTDEYASKVAADHGVACHIPPHPLASFHYPGATKFIVFTMLGHEIVWLPEQLGGWDGER